MADSQDKTVGIKFNVDVASADRARRVIQVLIDSVGRLVDVTSKVNFGGFGGGGGGAKVSSFSSVGGGGNVGTQMSQKAGGATNGVVDGLTRAVTQSSMLFKGASTGAIGSFKIMGDSLRNMVQVSDREIGKLEGNLSKLEKTFTKLKARAGAGKGGFTDRAIAANQSEYFSQVEQLGEANAARSSMNANLRKMNPTFGDKALGFFGINKGDFAPGGKAFTNPLGVIGSVAGSPAGAIGAGVALGWKIAGPLAASATSFESGNLGYALDNPMINLQNRASIGGTYGGLAVALRGGQVSKALAAERLLKNGQVEEIFGKAAFENAVAKAKTDLRTGVFDNLGAGDLGGASSAFIQKAGRVWSQGKLGGPGVVDSAGTALTAQELALKRSIQGASGDQATRYGQALSLEEQSNPYQNQMVNDIYGNTFGDIMGQNASRTSGLRVYNKKTKTWNIDYDLFNARQENSGYSPGMVSGKMGQLSDLLGRRLSGEGISKGILSSELGGLSSAAGIFSAGSQFGGGKEGGNALTKVVQGLIGGRKALDIGAGSSIGNLISQSMLSGNFRGGSGEGFASTLLGAAYTGNTGTQMFNARAMGSGLNAMNSFASGGLDPLQGAVNMSAAISAARNAPWQTKKILMSLDSASLLDIVKTKTIPAHLARTGITVAMVEDYVHARNGMAFARVNDTMLTSAGAAAVGKYRSQGIGFLKGMSKSGREQALTDLANASIVGTGHSFEADYEMFRIEAAGAGILGGPAGRGAHRSASMKSQQGHGAKAHGANTKGLGADKAAPGTNDVINHGLDVTPGMVNPLDAAGQQMVAALNTQTNQEIDMNKSLKQIVSLMGQLIELNHGHPIVGTGKGQPKANEPEDVYQY